MPIAPGSQPPDPTEVGLPAFAGVFRSEYRETTLAPYAFGVLFPIQMARW